jgi:hypothetical protein
MNKLSQTDWNNMTAAEKAAYYEQLADITRPGFRRDQYLEYAKILRQQINKGE